MSDDQPVEKRGFSLGMATRRLKSAYTEGVGAQLVRDSATLDFIIGPRRKGHYEEAPKDPKFLSARAAWVERWERITEEGRELGYLEQDHCYECGGETVPTTDVVDRTWVFDESEEDFEARKSADS